MCIRICIQSPPPFYPAIFAMPPMRCCVSSLKNPQLSVLRSTASTLATDRTTVLIDACLNLLGTLACSSRCGRNRLRSGSSPDNETDSRLSHDVAILSFGNVFLHLAMAPKSHMQFYGSRTPIVVIEVHTEPPSNADKRAITQLPATNGP